ncbi:gamma-glutamylcyclotransferase family protein [Falsiroseomonas sp. HW251]|uniref:gamma-glutamylcyclotransferase family protein n=1 Tax=Falsiroseomonas sp. HW251 TaxID=3390998 RepID=UPI003D31D294
MALPRLYAAYGSNLDHARLLGRCRGARPEGVAQLAGWRLAVNRYASILPVAAAAVPVGLWRVTPAHLRALDRWEGVAAGCYERIRVPLPDGNEAWTYVERKHRPGPPEDWYVAHLRQGYRDFGLDASPLDAALAEAGFAG